jgi:hypothetical protein
VGTPKGVLYVCQIKDVWPRPVNEESTSDLLVKKFKISTAKLKWRMSLSKLNLLIEKCNLVVIFFDNLEEERMVSLPETNFTKIVKVHHGKLLKA